MRLKRRLAPKTQAAAAEEEESSKFIRKLLSCVGVVTVEFDTNKHIKHWLNTFFFIRVISLIR